MIPETSPLHARRTAPAITVQTLSQELHERYPQEIPTEPLATKLVQQTLLNYGYFNPEPTDAVWSNDRARILEAFRRHYEDA